MMIDQYRNEVRKFYETQRDLGKLSINLTRPTVSRLRNECLMLFNEGCSRDDLRILLSFLGRPLNVELHESAIRRCDPDKFKALCNFMKRDIKTGEKNFEMLAWLIDFRPRQYSRYLEEHKKKRETVTGYKSAETSLMASEVFAKMEQVKRQPVLCDMPADIATVSLDQNSVNLNHRGSQHRDSQKSSRLSGRYFGGRNRDNEIQSNTRKAYEEDAERAANQQLSSKPDNSLDGAHTQITLEYPSGVKLSLATADLGLISKLIRL